MLDFIAYQFSSDRRRRMSVFDNDYFRINKFFLSCTGLWPYLSNGRKRFMRTIVLIVIILYLIPTIGGLYEVWGELDLMVECFIPIFTAFGCLVCTVTYMCKEKQLKGLLDCIESDWKFFSSREELCILESHAGDGRILTLLYTGCVGITGVTYMLTTIVPQILNIIVPLNETRPKKLPSQVEYFVNWEEYFNYIVIHMLITTVIEVSVLVGCRSTFTVLTEHACGLFSNVGYGLKRAMKNINFEKANEDPHLEELIFRDITFCVERHKRAIEFSKTIESCFSPCFFFIMGVTVILISTTLIQIVLHFDQLDDATKFGVYTVALIVDLYFNNLPAQRLMDHSISISDYIFEGIWYQMPLRSKKLLIMIIMRSSFPCVLTAGKMYVMNMDNFSSVLQMSLSYFTLLSSMRS